MITEDYMSFEISKLLKEKGFDWDCQYCYIDEDAPEKEQLEVPTGYDAEIAAPTLQMAMKWLREVHKIFISIGHCEYPTQSRVTWIPEITTFESVYPDSAIEYNSYEEACEEAIKYCLENLI